MISLFWGHAPGKRSISCFKGHMLVAACLLLFACCCLPAAACLLLLACCFLLAASCQLLPACTGDAWCKHFAEQENNSLGRLVWRCREVQAGDTSRGWECACFWLGGFAAKNLFVLTCVINNFKSYEIKVFYLSITGGYGVHT